MQNKTNDYLEMLSKDFPTIADVSSEIINLRAILSLPKGTEHFMSDIHGENEAFLHVLRNASGVIKTKIDLLFERTMTVEERNTLATLVYYPKRKLYYLKNQGCLNETWYKKTLMQLVELCRLVASKYSRSKVRKAMPKEYAYILDELLNTPNTDENKQDYYRNIVSSILETGEADEFICALCDLIRRLSIDRLHILGDVFDRGPRPDLIMDELSRVASIDFQWGNHDVEWIGASLGNEACIANVIRNALRFNNLDTLEIGYGINTRMLANFAAQAYADDPCALFMPMDAHRRTLHTNDAGLIAKMHKAITVIEFKVESQLYERHPEYEMGARDLFGRTEEVLKDDRFPTLDTARPNALSAGERAVMDALVRSFVHSDKLRAHMALLISKGSMYKCCNGNLLFHGCVPMTEDGQLASVDVLGEPLSGKAYLDACDRSVRQAFLGTSTDTDFLFYLWCGKDSPLFGKDKCATFESYLIADPERKKETKNPYYQWIEKPETCAMLFREFGLSEQGHIINGHVPVRRVKGESPVKAGGKLYVIDGGFSKPYQDTTGSYGYTLISNSNEYSITEHVPFTSIGDVIEHNFDLHSKKLVIEKNAVRVRVRDTDDGKNIENQITILSELLAAYRNGTMKEKQRRK